MSKKYIIFDFDGTIANTNDVITASWQASFRHYLGHELPVHTIEATFGEVLVTSISKLIPGVDVNEVADYYRNYQNDHSEEYPVYVFDGVRELIEELRARGCLIGVGTSRTASSFRKYMRALGMEDLVDEAVTMEDVTHHKPHQETVEATLLKLMAHDKEDWEAAEIHPENEGEDGDIRIPDEVRKEAIMIGDSKFDIACAQNAGVDSVLIGWSHYIDEEDMAAFGCEPTYRVETPAELLEIL